MTSPLPAPEPLVAPDAAPDTSAEDHWPVSSWLNALDGVSYLVDVDGVILAVSESAWNGFAAANGAPALTAAAMIGRNILDDTCGEAVRGYYRARHLAVLNGPTPWVAFEYRCDAPDIRRSMRMSISRLIAPGQPVRLLYQSQLLSAAARPWMSVFEPERIVELIRGESALPIQPMCSVCQKLSWVATGQQTAWIEADVYYRQGGEAEVRISHGVCPECLAAVS